MTYDFVIPEGWEECTWSEFLFLPVKDRRTIFVNNELKYFKCSKKECEGLV